MPLILARLSGQDVTRLGFFVLLLGSVALSLGGAAGLRRLRRARHRSSGGIGGGNGHMSDRWWRMAAGAILAFGFGLALLGTVLK